MFRIVCDPSSRSTELYLTEIIRSGSLMFVVCLVGVWQRNFELVCVCAYAVLRAVNYSKTCLKRNAIVPAFFFPFSQVSVLQRGVF